MLSSTTYVLFTFIPLRGSLVVPSLKLEANAGSDKSWVWTAYGDVSDDEARDDILAIRFANSESILFKTTLLSSFFGGGGDCSDNIGLNRMNRCPKIQGGVREGSGCREERLKQNPNKCVRERERESEDVTPCERDQIAFGSTFQNSMNRFQFVKHSSLVCIFMGYGAAPSSVASLLSFSSLSLRSWSSSSSSASSTSSTSSSSSSSSS